MRAALDQSATDSNSSRNADSPAIGPGGTGSFRSSGKMFGPTSESLPPTSNLGFPQQNLQTMTFQGGLPSRAGGTGSNLAVESFDMQEEGNNQNLEEEGSQEYFGSGAGDDVSRQRERNRYCSGPMTEILSPTEASQC